MKNFKQINQELKKAIIEGPTFSDKSRFQLEKFVIGANKGEAREYRQLLLQINEKSVALNKSEIRRKKIKAEIGYLNEQLTSESNQYKKTMLECDIEDKILDLEQEEKLIMDAAVEFSTMYSIFTNMPKFTAEEFEQNELEYWKNRLIKDAQLQVLERGTIEAGTAKALNQMGFNPLQLQVEIKTVNQLESMAASDNILKIMAPIQNSLSEPMTGEKEK